MSNENNNKREDVDVFELFSYFGRKFHQFINWLKSLAMSVAFFFADLVLIAKKRWYLFIASFVVVTLYFMWGILFSSSTTLAGEKYSKKVIITTNFSSSKQLVFLLKDINSMLSEYKYEDLSKQLDLPVDYIKSFKNVELSIDTDMESLVLNNEETFTQLLKLDKGDKKDNGTLDIFPLQSLLKDYQSRQWGNLDEMLNDPFFELFKTFAITVNTSKQLAIFPFVKKIMAAVAKDERVLLNQEMKKHQLALEQDNLTKEKSLIEESIQQLTAKSKSNASREKLNIDLKPSEDLSKLHAQLTLINESLVKNKKESLEAEHILVLGNLTQNDLTIYQAKRFIRDNPITRIIPFSLILFYSIVIVIRTIRWLNRYEKSKTE